MTLLKDKKRRLLHLNGKGFQNPFRVDDDPLSDMNNIDDLENGCNSNVFCGSNTDDILDDSNSSDSVEFERFSTYDDVIPESSTSSDADVLETTCDNKITLFGKTSANNLMLLSLLEHMCTLYTDDDETSRRLFHLLCEKLYGLRLIQNFGHLDDVKAIRQKYQAAFVSLMGSALEGLKDSVNVNPLNTEKMWHMTTSRQNIASVPLQSWYKDMFCEESKIAFGGFGEVVQAKNKLDQKSYAIKKVKLIESQPDICHKTLREVQVFSNLNHCNVVRYHSSWLEYGLTEFTGSQNDEFNTNGTGGAFSSASGDLFSNNHNFRTFNVGLLKGRTSDSNVQYKNGSRCRADSGFNTNVPCSESPSDEKKEECRERVNSFSRSFSSGDLPDSNQQLEEISYWEKGKFYRGNLRRVFNMTLFIQMELCQLTLRKWIDDRNSKIQETRMINRSTNINIFKQVLLALDYIHNQGLIHRDIKPANVFINFKGEDMIIKIGDFGLARDDNIPKTPTKDLSLFDVQASCVEFKPAFTGLTEGVGTAVYAAPEQKYSSNYSCNVDIFSVGIILFELFRVFNTEMERLKSIKDLLNIQSCGNSDHNCADVCKLMLQMTSKDPEQRPSASCILNSEVLKDKTDTEGICHLQQKIHEQEMEIHRLRGLVTEMESRLCSECQLACTHKKTNLS